MRLALIISLAVNMFLVGAIGAGAVILRASPGEEAPHERHHRRGPDLDLFTMRDIEQLPEPYRVEMREAMRTRMPEAWTLFRRLHETRMESYRLMGEAEFDEAAFRENSERLKQLKAESQDLLADTLIDIVVTLPAEERQAMAERIIARHEEAAERFRRRIEKRRGEERMMAPPREED